MYKPPSKQHSFAELDTVIDISSSPLPSVHITTDFFPISVTNEDMYWRAENEERSESFQTNLQS